MSTDKLYVLVVGSGGREHAIAWNLSRSSRVERIYVAPGNGGTESGIDKVSNINIGVSDFFSLTKFAQENNINLVIPGPEQPLVDGIESAFKKTLNEARIHNHVKARILYKKIQITLFPLIDWQSGSFNGKLMEKGTRQRKQQRQQEEHLANILEEFSNSQS
ncbi:unnamed protein product [Rhizophagus irregularis]|nr:unnamed protein product [Rhizophagus irregularis]